MSWLGKKQQQWLWRSLLAIGLVVEIVFIVVTVITMFEGVDEIPLWQAVTFMVIAVWIYIAYLKQRSLDISRYVVDEKVKTHALVRHLRDGLIVLSAKNRILLANDKAIALTGLSEVAILDTDLTLYVDEDGLKLLNSQQSGEVNTTLSFTGRTVHICLIVMPENADGNNNKLVYVQPVQATTSSLTAEHQTLDLIRQSLTVLDQLTNLAHAATVKDKTQAAVIVRALSQRFRLAARLAAAGQSPFAESLETPPAPIPTTQTLNRLIDEALAELTPLCQILNITFDRAPTPVPLNVCIADASLGLAIRQVLTNAVADSMTTGTGRCITIRTAPMGAHIGLAITDKAAPVSASTIAQFFAEPYRGITADTGVMRTESSGLFLARRLVEGQGGALMADSTPEGELRVTLMLPGACHH